LKMLKSKTMKVITRIDILYDFSNHSSNTMGIQEAILADVEKQGYERGFQIGLEIGRKERYEINYRKGREDALDPCSPFDVAYASAERNEQRRNCSTLG
jgi:hypothetical protein